MNHLENIDVLIAAVEQQEELDLSTFRSAHRCGTLFCIAGLIPTLPHFQALGVTANTWGAPAMNGAYHPVYNAVVDVIEKLFGNPLDEHINAWSFEALCERHGEGLWDEELGAEPGALGFDLPSDKELALRRLRRFREEMVK